MWDRRTIWDRGNFGSSPAQQAPLNGPRAHKPHAHVATPPLPPLSLAVSPRRPRPPLPPSPAVWPRIAEAAAAMAMLFRRRPYTDASNRAASAFLLGTHPSLGARSPVLGLMERGPQCLTKIAPFLLEPRPLAMALSGCHDSTLRLWDLREGRCAVTLKGHRCRVHAVAADFGSMQALSGSGDNTLRLWDLREGRCTATLEGHGGSALAVTANFGRL